MARSCDASSRCRLFAHTAIACLAALLVIAVQTAAYPSIGCTMQGCDQNHTNSVPLPVPTPGDTLAFGGPSSVGVVWSANYTGLQGSGGCASTGQTAWCPGADSVVSFNFAGAAGRQTAFHMVPGQVPLVTYVLGGVMVMVSSGVTCAVATRCYCAAALLGC